MEIIARLANLPGALPGACAQGLIWGIMAIGVYLTYRILDVADLTVDGSFGTGGAVCVMCLLSGMNVWAALAVAVLLFRIAVIHVVILPFCNEKNAGSMVLRNQQIDALPPYLCCAMRSYRQNESTSLLPSESVRSMHSVNPPKLGSVSLARASISSDISLDVKQNDPTALQRTINFLYLQNNSLYLWYLFTILSEYILYLSERSMRLSPTATASPKSKYE